MARKRGVAQWDDRISRLSGKDRRPGNRPAMPGIAGRCRASNKRSGMKTSPLAGKPAQPAMLVNVPRLVTAYYGNRPDPSVPAQRVAFGTSGHRGSAFENSFNEWHVLAISQAICDYRMQQHIDGPLFLGFDTHALSEPAFSSALEVLAANGVEVMLADKDDYTPTPVISHAILTYNRGRDKGLADGIVITPSHHPPDSGGFQYNPPTGGPADKDVTGWNDALDPTFRSMTADWDGRIRMDPSSSYAMQSLIGLKDRFDIAFACDTDHDRHGIVTRHAGLLL